jgi:sarcosine oxidase subunit gamma
MADLATNGVPVTTPLSHTAPYNTDRLSFEELPLLGKITLRGKPEDKAFMGAAEKALGVALPTEPMTSAAKGDLRVFWKAFDEWLIWTAKDAETALIAKLRDALADIPRTAVTDISDYYTVIRVTGDLSRELLAKGCPLDLHPSVFAEGQATGCGFHHATLFVTRVEADTFDIMIRWSFADYLWTYLVDGAREWEG